MGALRRTGTVCLMISTFVLLVTMAANVQAAHAETDTGAQVEGSDGVVHVAVGEIVIVAGSSSAPGTSGGPVYACYFSTVPEFPQYFYPNTTGPELQVGETYDRVCNDDAGAQVIFDQIVYDPAPGALGGVTAFEIREFIVNNLVTPPPVIPELSPDGQQITGVATWFWVPPADRIAGPESASAGGLTVQVRAKLIELEIDVGVPGEPTIGCSTFTEWSAGATDPECSYTYLTEPPSGQYPLTTTAAWTFEWLDHDSTVWEPFGTVFPVDAIDVLVADLEAIIGTSD